MQKAIKNILFINFGGLGDEILFLPAIISVKKEFPDCKITLALEKRSSGITELTDIIDETLFADIKGKHKYFEMLKLLFKIWSKNFDIVVASGSNKFISIFLFGTFIPQRIGYNTGRLSKFLLTNAVDLNKNQYASKMYHDLVRSVTNINTEIAELSVERKPIEPDTILIHPGVSLMSIKKGMIKTVPANIWAEVIIKLSDNGKKVILIGGPDDKETVTTIQHIVPDEKYINLYGKTKNVRELAEEISKAEKFLCSDSAPLHIAAALGTKTYAIFGSTDDKKLIPENGVVTPIKANCSCPLRPCLWEKRQTTCETLECLNLTSDEIVEKISTI
ncbi:glycosyltransferase family 9 protein [bacterium]|nr:glycosyltransferase family 9 protein [bacterium]